MDHKKYHYNFSEDLILNKAIEQIKRGRTYEEVKEEFNLSVDDIELIDFVINEF
ncbi:hypothetical protein ACOJQI_15930 [Bacillus salacetis]|uniref:hypothetical protein n=1 Tax=Bacillus salacetis TaxID=2315464 RepID=UPI003BA37418